MNVEAYQYKGADDAWAYILWEVHENLHWLPREVSMAYDVFDWNKRLSTGDREFLKSILKFFTQADIEVHDTYIHDYLPRYNTLGVKQMLTGFSARECVHVMGYAYGLEELVKGEEQQTLFRAWQDEPVLQQLHQAMDKYRGCTDDASMFKHMVVTTLLGEGVMLFAQFAMLLNYARSGYMRGLGQIVSWSIRDEDTHVYGVTQLMKRDDRFKMLDKKALYKEVYDEVMPLIINFAAYCYENSDYYSTCIPLENRLYFEDVIQFLEFQAQRRYRQAGIGTEDTIKNPFKWFDAMVAGTEVANFFEQRPTEYSKSNLVGTYAYGTKIN